MPIVVKRTCSWLKESEAIKLRYINTVKE